MNLEINWFNFCRHRFDDHGLHHHSHVVTARRFFAIRTGGDHCDQRIVDEVRNTLNGVPYISGVDGLWLFRFCLMSAWGCMLLWQDTIRQLVERVFSLKSCLFCFAVCGFVTLRVSRAVDLQLVCIMSSGLDHAMCCGWASKKVMTRLRPLG